MGTRYFALIIGIVYLLVGIIRYLGYRRLPQL